MFPRLLGLESVLCWYSPALFEGQSEGLGSCFEMMATVYSVLTECNSETGNKALDEPRCEKTGLRGFRPCPTQTGLYSHKRWLEA